MTFQEQEGQTRNVYEALLPEARKKQLPRLEWLGFCAAPKH